MPCVPIAVWSSADSRSTRAVARYAVAYYFEALSESKTIARDVCLVELGWDPLKNVPLDVFDGIDTTTPFLIADDGNPIALANRYLSDRAQAQGVFEGLAPLQLNSSIAFGRDLEYFLTTYQDPRVGTLKNGKKLLKHYRKHLLDSRLSSSTIDRRFGSARALLSYVSDSSVDCLSSLEFIEAQVVSRIVSDSNQRINVRRQIGMSTGRRRHPSTIFLLPPFELARFLDSFKTRALRASAKLIFATGARVSEVAGLRAGDIARLKPIYPGGPASLKVLGKGGKERSIEIEPALIVGLQHYLTCKDRMNLAKLFAAKTGCSPFDDRAPLFLNKDGVALTATAITDGFRRASIRCQIKRTPHELRHEFAVSYLLNTYRAIAKKVERAGFDAWLARLMIEGASSALLRLSHLLGHGSVETTKKDYMRLLVAADPSLRDAWCEHLDLVGASSL